MQNAQVEHSAILLTCIKITHGFKALILYLRQVSLFLFCFVALRPKSTAMVIAGQSVHLTTLFPGQA